MKKHLCFQAICLGWLFLFVCAVHADTPTDYEQVKAQLGERSLPLINLVVDLNKVSKPVYTQASMEVCDPMRRMAGKELVPFRCKVKYRGSSSLRYEKKSFTIKLVDSHGEECDANLLGLRNGDTWVLDAMAIDRIRMRNRVNFDVWNDMSRVPYQTDFNRRNGTVGLFVELFVNGDYHGLYCLTDKVNRKLLALKKTKVGEQGDSTIRGVLYKGVEWSMATKLNGYEPTDTWQHIWNGWELAYPEELPCEPSYGPLVRFIDYCSKTTDQQLVDGVAQRFYMGNLCDYMVFLLSQGVWDNLFKNAYLSVVNINKSERILITPWDLDCSLGGSWNGDYADIMTDQWLVRSAGLTRRLWEGNLAAFKSLVSDRWKALHESILSEEALGTRLDDYAQQFVASGAWEREYDKWNGNPVPLKRDLSEEVSYVKDWYHRNATYLRDYVFRGVESEIGDVLSDKNEKQGRKTVYNLAGQRVSSSYKGLVIIDGRKQMRR